MSFKQHITEEQLRELTEEGVGVLGRWLDKNGYLKKKAKIYSYIDDELFFDFENYPTLLSIGQMIEFLDEKTPNLTVSKNNEGFWHIREWGENSIGVNTQLCDAIWEAVKELLNSETGIAD